MCFMSRAGLRIQSLTSLKKWLIGGNNEVAALASKYSMLSVA